jgi:hypothetical protein
MNPQDAGELAHLWALAHENPAEMGAHTGPVSRTLRELAPDGKPTGIAQTPTGPAMVILLDDALLVFQSRPLAALGDTSMPVRARLVRLDEATSELEVTERFEEDAGAPPARTHAWQLRAGGVDLRIDGREVVRTGMDGGPDPNEKLGRAIAGRLGWVLP